MILLPATDRDLSRRDTTREKLAYLAGAQLPLGAELGRRAWVHRAMRVRVVESRRDRDVAAAIVKRRHYLARWPVPPKTLVLSYLADLEGVEPGPAAAAGLVMVSLLPAQCHVARALEVQQYERLTLVRTWRADDLVPAVAPDFTPELLRRVVRGERGRGPLGGLVEEWSARKLRAGGLRATPRLLVTHADPALGHDGALYVAAGATFCGVASKGKLAFAWALDEVLREPLRQLGRAVAEREASRAA